MFRKTLIAPLLAASAMALTVSPAYAGKDERAREAIASAEAKIQTAEKMGAGKEMPTDAAQARATLARAKESLERGDEHVSIEYAIQASAMADSAIGILQRDKDREVAAANSDATVAQERAASAERSAAASAAEAQAARVAAQTPQVETTVTTQQPAPRTSARTATKKTTTTTRRSTAAPSTTTTTTTVKQATN